MRTVKIKVKHILLIVLGVLIAVYVLIPSGFFVYADYLGSKNQSAAASVYQKYFSLYKTGINRDEALYNAAQALIPYGASKITIQAASMTWGPYVEQTKVDKTIDYYSQIVGRYKNGEYYSNAYSSLCYLYTVTGRINKAQELINKGLASDNSSIRLTASKYKMIYLAQSGNTGEAIELGNEILKKVNDDTDIYNIINRIYLMNRDYDKTSNDHKKYALANTADKGIQELFLTSEYLYPGNTRSESDEIADNEVHGQIIADGKPVPFARVYLKRISEGNYISNTVTSGFYGISDFNGNYSIYGVPKEKYMIGIQISNFYISDLVYQTPEDTCINIGTSGKYEYDFSFVKPLKLTKGAGENTIKDRKFEIEWEPVYGADYYTVNCTEFENPDKKGGSSVQFAISEKIIENSFEIDIDQINMKVRNYMSNSNGEVNPQGYLGVFYPGCRVPVFINAYDRTGKKLTSSVPLIVQYDKIASVALKSEGLTQADKLILDMRPEEAAALYEKELEKNPDDIRTLRILSRIYELGTHMKINEKDEVKGKNTVKAVELLEKLFKLTGDYSYKKRVIQICYWENKDYKKVIDEYHKIPEKYMDIDDYSTCADVELRRSNFEEADRYYDKVYSLCDTNISDLNAVFLNVYQKDYESALKFLKLTDLSLRSVSRDSLARSIESLKKVDTNSKDYKSFERGLEMELTVEYRKDSGSKFIDNYKNIKDPVLYDFLDQIKDYEGMMGAGSF